MPQSFKAEVIADAGDQWVSNALRFATEEEAQSYVTDLSWRWLAVRKTRVTSCEDPITHRLDEGRLTSVETP
jgi:hypothetical protein